MSGPLAVPFVDLPGLHAPIRAEISAVVDKVLRHGQFILGDEVAAFERAFAALCGTRFAVGVNSGLDALVVALRVAGVAAGDEVIMPPNSFVATAAAAGLLGARPVFADVAADLNIDPCLIERTITKKTKAILPVHLTGRPAAMHSINAIAAKHGLAVVEDAAQAVAARYEGKATGALGDLGCFSLHPLKTLNACGDGGVLTTNDEALYRRMVALRNHGLESRDSCAEWGYNSRLDTLQAAILLVKLPHLAGWTARRRIIACRYREALAGLVLLDLPAATEGVEAVYHTFVIQTDHRDDLRRHLADNGIGSAIHYPIPIHLQPAAAYLGYKPGAFPVAERQARRQLSIPVHHGLSDAQVDRVIDVIREWARTQ
jgi:dTDP-4-amino-4,6-dideoxygalactose transaminase